MDKVLAWLALAVIGLGIAGILGKTMVMRHGPLWPGRGGHARRRGDTAGGQSVRTPWRDVAWLATFGLSSFDILFPSTLLRWLGGGIAVCMLTWMLDRDLHARARLDSWVKARARRLRDRQAGEEP